ncbi:MAG TPA: STAS domain-containing protein [Actinocrinis sp.]|uniref:STAS domain-containing protein n=1 Tax=Actinocrinis sp. TaxID=1920516 RepID=UPI002DDD4EF8|nr:STAS domain-containing protein [Actinocrinis sp.]HEV3170078.1 STAS domain-containing protein [Actinocrinis sp.]
MSAGESGTGRFVVSVRGELDLAAAERLWMELEPLIVPEAVVVLDGTEMTFLDSSGLRVLLQAAKRASASKAVFRLVAPQPPVQRVLELAGTAGFLDTRDDVQSALAG